MNEHRIRSVLGWGSVAIGVTALLDTARVVKVVGLGDRMRLARALALRDLVIGLATLTQPRLRQWVWVRVFADTTDTLMHGYGCASGRFPRRRALVVMLVSACFAVGDTIVARRLGTDAAQRAP